MGRRKKKIRLSSNDVAESKKVLHINSLPEEILLKIFGKLKYQDLCRSGRVCKKWHAVTKHPVFWKRVDIQFLLGKRSMYEPAKKFIEILPACVTHLRLDFQYSRDWLLNIIELLKLLRANCPNLEVLVLQRARLPDNISSVLHLGEEHFANIRVLVLQHSLLNDLRQIFNDTTCSINSKIEVLDISRSNGIFSSTTFYKMLPNLKKLRLAGTSMQDDSFFLEKPFLVSRLQVLDIEGKGCDFLDFALIRDYGFNLVELYVCFTQVRDDDLLFDNSKNPFPCLKIICLRGLNVTYEGVSSLIKSCPSLEHVYVGTFSKESSDYFAECCSNKVHIIHDLKYCDHYAQVDYMRE